MRTKTNHTLKSQRKCNELLLLLCDIELFKIELMTRNMNKVEYDWDTHLSLTKRLESIKNEGLI